MQHNRVTVLSSSETYHLGSSSNIPDMDPDNATVDEQIFVSNGMENNGFPRFLINSQETGTPSGNRIGQQSTGLNLWEPAGSSSMGCLADHDNFFQSKREHFAPPLSIGGPLRIDRRRQDGTSSLPSHNLNIDLNLNQSDQFGAEDAEMVPPSSGQSRTNTILGNMGSSTGQRIPRHEVSLDAIGSSSRSADTFDGAAGQEGGVLDSRHLLFKRKNIDGSCAESSANGSSRNRQQNTNAMLLSESSATRLNMPAASNYAVPYHPMEQLNESTNVATSPLSDRYSLYNDPQEHGFVRNTRMRLSPNDYDQSLPSLLPEGSFRCSYQPTLQSSSFIPVQPRQTSSSVNAQGRPHLPAVTQFSQNLHRPSSDGNFGAQFGGSSSSPDTTIHISSSNDRNGSLMRSDLPEPLPLGSFFDADSTTFPTAPISRGDQQNAIFSSISTARSALNVGTHQVPGTNLSQPAATIRASAEMARRSLISAARSSSIALHNRGSSSTSNDIRSQQPGSSSRAPQQHYVRGGPQSADRQSSTYLDLQSFMQNIAASRDGSRTVSEFRNVVDQIRQGRNARLEDLLLIDRSLIIRRANLIDRHREMRLDVDNMSYEELLALGERIGYVNTGLTEEKIITSLKQRKYVCLELEESSTIIEPCCICQEDYVEGEDVGRLDCGHDFHTACIKQWLVIKNLCPVCKKTALGT